jgi:hypothetical protein
MAVSFIGGENQSTRRKPPTCRKSLKNFIPWCCIEYTSPWTRFKFTTLVVIGTDCTGSFCKSIRSWPQWPLKYFDMLILTIYLCTTTICISDRKDLLTIIDDYQKFFICYSTALGNHISYWTEFSRGKIW